MAIGHASLLCCMSCVVVLLLACMLVTPTSALSPLNKGKDNNEQHRSILHTEPLTYHPSSPSLKISPTNSPTIPPHKIVSPNNGSASSNNTQQTEVCLDCIAFMQKNLDTLIIIVEKIGVTGTCDKLCGMLNNTIDIDACDVMCAAIGIESFWQLFVKVGINPIYACELVNSCTAQKYPAVMFTSSVISPSSGPPGTVFQFKIQFTVINETGVGETAFVIYYPTETGYGIGYISEQIFPDYVPGAYQANLTFPTNASFLVGKYLIIFDLCSGACGQDPEIYPFASEELAFNITNIGE